MSDRLGTAWRDYRVKVMPLAAPAIQATECRRAFYAGAQAMIAAMLSFLGHNDDPATEQELADMDALQAELDRFANDVKAGRA
jgi:hypothetical protein